MFGEYVDRRGLTQTDIAAMGGPSTTSQTKIRTTDEPVAPGTLRKIDKVMGWEHGTAARIIAGDPVRPDQHSITNYSDEEIIAEVRRRILDRGGSNADATPQQKSPEPERDPAGGRASFKARAVSRSEPPLPRETGPRSPRAGES